MAQQLELGLDTFGDVTVDAAGERISYAEVIRGTIAEGVLADEVGVDFIGIGEHHRDDFAVSAPEIVLAAIAGQTTRIKLGTAVTVLSSDDPIRVFQKFATLDAASDGRAEIILGRGSFTESFPLFGFDLADYEKLFEEKLDLFSHLLTEQPVTWSGTTRPPLTDQHVYPKTDSGHITTWIGVGGSPQSVVRAATYGLPMMLAIIGGAPDRFAPYADLYRRALTQLEQPVLPIGVHSPGFVADTDEEARELYFVGHKALHDRIGAERGWPPMGREQYLDEIEHGSLYVGAPETVAKKIAATAKSLGLDRFDLKYSSGPLQHGSLMRAIELYGTKVIPMVRDILS